MQAQKKSGSPNRLMKKTSTVLLVVGTMLSASWAQADLGQKLTGDAAIALYQLLDASETVVREVSGESALLMKSADNTTCFRMLDLSQKDVLSDYECFVLSEEDRAR